MDLPIMQRDNPARQPAPPLAAVRISYENPNENGLALARNPSRSGVDWITLALLILITLLGGILRFYRLTYPPLWNDEALVYWRVCGTYGEMLKPLSLDGFPPLHYSLYWLIGHYHTLTPFVMRLVPAISGTLTIPAIYFLARQMLSKSVALLAALFTACSAFMLFYSRDAKMYPDVWLCITLNVACFLWWCRTSNSTAFLGWIAAGCAMVGLHASAFAIPVITLLMFFTQRKLTWQKTLLLLLGLLLIASGPVIYATKFNHWAERVEEEGWKDSGIGWVNGFFNGNRTGPDHVLYTTAAFLTAYEWPRDDYLDTNYNQPIDPALRDLPQTAFKECIWILAIGLLPWPFFFRRQAVKDASREPGWRSFFWLGSWIIVCGYGAYCHSVRDFDSPRRWIWETEQTLGIPGLAILFAIVAGFTLLALTHPKLRPGWTRFVQLLLASTALWTICYIIFLIAWPMWARAEITDDPWQSVWTPRYLGFIWPAFGIACAVLLMRLPTRAVRIACILFVLAVNLGAASMRFVIGTEPPIEQIANDIVISQDPKSNVRTFNFIQNGDIAYAGTAMNAGPRMATGRYYLEMDSHREPMNPDIFVQFYNDFKMRSNQDYNWFRQILKTSPQVNDVIIWTILYPPQYDHQPHAVAFDPYRKVLGTSWKMKSEEVSTVHNYWDWRERWKWVRREYVRK